MGGWERGGPAGGSQRRIDEGGERQGGGDDPEGGQSAQPAREDQWADGVADRHHRDLAERDEVDLPDVEADDRTDADDADEESEPAAAAEPCALPAQRHDQRTDERHRRDQEPRQRARQSRFRMTEQ